jgi:pilus assembly protein CpaE
MQETSVVLGMQDLALQEEVLHFLERLPRVRVVGAAADGRGAARKIRDRRPDAVVVSPEVIGEADLNGAGILVVASRETTSALRAALRAGARGFYLWPEEREALARDTERFAKPLPTERPNVGRVVSVFGPRGGTGVTFMATNLAGACADRGADTVLVDLDAFYADVTAALGIAGEGVPTVADLAPVADELTEDHLRDTLHPHPRGFRVLLSPHRPLDRGLSPPVAAAALRLLRAHHDLVLVHLPRGLDRGIRAALEASDIVLVVVTLDVLALRNAQRAMDVLRAAGLESRCRLVMNRVRRGEVIPADAERVLGLPAAAVIREDRSVARAQDRGELVAGRSTPAARRLTALARRLLDEEAS